MTTNPAINLLNEIVSGMTGQEVTGLGSIYFFLIFTLLFSISFAATAFVPMFKDDEKYKNIRIIVSLSIAFLTSISSYAVIVSQLQVFGLLAAIALGVSIAILAVVPKEKRKKEGVTTAVMWVGIAAALLIFFTFILEIDWFTPLVDYVVNNYQTFLQGNAFYWLIIIIIFIVVVAIAINASIKQQKPN